MDQHLAFLVLVQYPSPRGIRCTEPVGKRPKPDLSVAAGTANSDVSTSNRSVPMLPNAAWIKCYQPHPKMILSMDSYGTDICSVPQLQHIIFPAADPSDLHSVSSTSCADFPRSNSPRDMGSIAT